MQIKGREIGSGIPCICVPVVEHTKEAIVKEIIELADTQADMIEWRIDAYDDFRNNNAVRSIFEEVAPFLKEKIFLYTFRSKAQGGLSEITSEELKDLHDLAIESKCVDLLDLEFFELSKPAEVISEIHKAGMKVVASHHDFQETPKLEVMRMLLESMHDGGADIVKLAVMPNAEEDVLSLLFVTDEFRKAHKNTPIITMSMGKMGVISRLCGESFGSSVTFAAKKKASAPGQMDLADVSDILKMIHKSIDS